VFVNPTNRGLMEFGQTGTPSLKPFGSVTSDASYKSICDRFDRSGTSLSARQIAIAGFVLTP
jgi:hypothetical protein